jgi:hypothetical protein
MHVLSCARFRKCANFTPNSQRLLRLLRIPEPLGIGREPSLNVLVFS